MWCGIKQRLEICINSGSAAGTPNYDGNFLTPRICVELATNAEVTETVKTVTTVSNTGNNSVIVTGDCNGDKNTYL